MGAGSLVGHLRRHALGEDGLGGHQGVIRSHHICAVVASWTTYARLSPTLASIARPGSANAITIVVAGGEWVPLGRCVTAQPQQKPAEQPPPPAERADCRQRCGASRWRFEHLESRRGRRPPKRLRQHLHEVETPSQTTTATRPPAAIKRVGVFVDPMAQAPIGDGGGPTARSVSWWSRGLGVDASAAVLAEPVGVERLAWQSAHRSSTLAVTWANGLVTADGGHRGRAVVARGDVSRT